MWCDRVHMPRIKTFPFTDDRKTAKQRQQNQQDHSSTAASLHHGHLTMLSTSTSDTMSPLTWMQIYNPPWASLPFHHRARQGTAATITYTWQMWAAINLFIWLCQTHTCHICHMRDQPRAQTVSVFLGSTTCLLWGKKGPKSSSGSVRSSTSMTYSNKTCSTQELPMTHV